MKIESIMKAIDAFDQGLSDEINYYWIFPPLGGMIKITKYGPCLGKLTKIGTI